MADPGFPTGAGRQPQWGRQPIILAICSRKLNEIEKKIGSEGAFLAPPLNPPLFCFVNQSMPNFSNI